MDPNSAGGKDTSQVKSEQASTHSSIKVEDAPMKDEDYGSGGGGQEYAIEYDVGGQIRTEESLRLAIRDHVKSVGSNNQEQELVVRLREQAGEDLGPDGELQEDLNNLERRMARKQLEQKWKMNVAFRNKPFIWQHKVTVLSREIEVFVFEKCDERVGDQYRSLIQRILLNIHSLEKFQGVSELFLNSKLKSSKLKCNNGKFKRTCIMIEKKLSESMQQQQEAKKKKNAQPVSKFGQQLLGKGGQSIQALISDVSRGAHPDRGQISDEEWHKLSELRLKNLLNRGDEGAGGEEKLEIPEMQEEEGGQQFEVKRDAEVDGEGDVEMKGEKREEEEEDDSLESLETNSAIFSDCQETEEERQKDGKNVVNMKDIVDRYDYTHTITLYRRNNPLQQQILYDPKCGSKLLSQRRIPRGSLLKVWEGDIEFSKRHHPFSCAFKSTRDARAFQQLGRWPEKLSIVGRSAQGDVVRYLENFLKAKELVYGWVEPSDRQRYCFDACFQQLEEELKFGVIKMNGDAPFTLYVFPLVQFYQSFLSGLSLSYSDIKSDKAMVFIGLIKNKYSLGYNFLTPQVLELREESEKPSHPPNDQISDSPPQQPSQQQQQQQEPSQEQQQSQVDARSRYQEDLDVIEMQEVLEKAESGRFTPEQVLKLVQEKLKETNMMEKVSSYNETKRQILQEILSKLIKHTQLAQAPQQKPPERPPQPIQHHQIVAQSAMMNNFRGYPPGYLPIGQYPPIQYQALSSQFGQHPVSNFNISPFCQGGQPQIGQFNQQQFMRPQGLLNMPQYINQVSQSPGFLLNPANTRAAMMTANFQYAAQK